MISDSERTGARLLQALNVKGWSKRRLAQATGCNEHTIARMCGGQDRMSIDLLCRAMRVLGFAPEQLFDHSEITADYTGIESIDKMLTEIYYERSATGVEALAQYVHPDYRCCSYSYSPTGPLANHLQPVARRTVDGVDLWGIPFELERQYNQADSTTRGRELWHNLHNVVVGPPNQVVVDFAIDEVRNTVHSTATHRRLIVDVLQFDAKLGEIARGTPPRIIRKIWSSRSVQSAYHWHP